ncbi:MAG TPA: 4-alpha-glucanotransferase [Candidatus Acidoferrales bacterium]|nr:4-alpha-glucanotransferase [Candidatus Acidoferrales bacterium]
MLKQRRSGILLHPTSLPSNGGIGDFGPAAHDFVEFLASARQGLWQILPLAPAGIGNSPYSATSAFAGDVLMVSLERLAEHGMVSREKVAQLPNPKGRVNFDVVRSAKMPLLQEAATSFLHSAWGEHRARFERFCSENSWWLEDFVLFDALRKRYKGESWNKWPQDLALRNPASLESTRKELAEELAVARFLQFAFFEQWRALHAHCRRKDVRIIGDIAIFVSYDSADVWTHPDIFRLDRQREPEVVAGVPPDAFSETGQRWGNPVYRWDTLRDRGYDWWVRRVRWALGMCDIIRLDHFRGFQQYWAIPANEPTAVNGKWVDGPKEDLFQVLYRVLGDLPFIAEDLGLITEDVHALRERLGIPGMRVLQFGFGDPGAHIYLPHKYVPNTIVYTGTHDNDTTVGWWESCTEHEREDASAYLGEMKDGITWAMIRAALNSVANLCVFPAQDVLSLDRDARMNTPSLSDGNWGWRLEPGALTSQLAEKLAHLIEVSDRVPSGVDKQGYRESPEDFAA